MKFIEVKGPSDEEAWLSVDSVEAVEWYNPSGRLSIRTKSGQRYYDTVKPVDFLLKINADLIVEPETKEKKRG